MSKHNPPNIAADNRRARHEYTILDEIEAGLCLLGTEVKSLRSGQANIQDAYAEARTNDNGTLEIFLVNAYIPEYQQASDKFNHKTRRDRKLLLHAQEIKKFSGKVQKKGLTLIPLDIHWNAKGIAKVKLALCSGKSNYDKRQTQKDRDWKRQQARILKE